MSKNNQPEKQLWAAVLLQAFEDLKLPNNTKQNIKNKQEAVRWFLLPDSGLKEICQAVWLNYFLTLAAAKKIIKNQVGDNVFKFLQLAIK